MARFKILPFKRLAIYSQFRARNKWWKKSSTTYAYEVTESGYKIALYGKSNYTQFNVEEYIAIS